MNAFRTIPGRPIQTGSAAARKIIDLLVACLDASTDIDQAAARSELTAAESCLAQLVNAGHLAQHELVLVAARLRLTVACPVGAIALASAENLTPARGAATADSWMLYIPLVAPYDELHLDLIKNSDHLSTEEAPAEATGESVSSRSFVDLESFARAAGERR